MTKRNKSYSNRVEGLTGEGEIEYSYFAFAEDKKNAFTKVIVVITSRKMGEKRTQNEITIYKFVQWKFLNLSPLGQGNLNHIKKIILVTDEFYSVIVRKWDLCKMITVSG